MVTLKLVVINDKTEVDKVLSILESGQDIQLAFESLKDFDNFFPKFSDLLYEYVFQVKSLRGPDGDNVFEDTVKILSKLEDVLETEIRHIVIDAKHHEDIKQLIEFYYDDLQDGSLTIAILVPSEYEDYDNVELFKSPIEVIAYIERNSLPGITLCLDHSFLRRPLTCTDHNYYKSVLPYTSAIYIMMDKVNLL